MKSTARPALTAAFVLLLAAAAGGAVSSPTLHPMAAPLPFAHQGPFVTTGDGGVLCVEAQHALASRDEGRTWTSKPIFRDQARYAISDERALLRTRQGVVIAAWMNNKEKKSPPGWNWGASGVDWRQFVLPIYVCRSLDDGRTWEEPVFLNKPWCGCIHSMLWNHPPRHNPQSGSSREELSIAFSSDECATWSPPRVIAANYGRGGRVSYPYLYERKPGELWITTMQGGLRMKINVSDLASGELPAPNVREPLR